MQLPIPLQTAIEQVTVTLGLPSLIEAREELTKRYRHPTTGTQFMTTDAQRQAYVISRMPATYAALQSAFKAIRERGDVAIKSVLDLGAGPGTGMWAVCDNFPDIETITLMEKDRSLLALGQQLAQWSEKEAIKRALWQESDLEKLRDIPSHDCLLFSYSIGEIDSQCIEPLLNLCWNATQQLLVIVEPGTPVGFERIRLIRRLLIEWGAHLIAPCPHHLTCPMAGGDWCHFAARVERTALHRRLKGGTLGYEDEKFSYVAVTKAPFPLPAARILQQPERHSGHAVFKLCTPEGVQYPTISKKMGERYKRARKAEWGDCFENN